MWLYKGYITQQCLTAVIVKWKSAVDSGKSFGVLVNGPGKSF